MRSQWFIAWLLALLLTGGYVIAQESTVSTDIPPIPECAADLTVAAMNITTNIDAETATSRAIIYPSGGSPFVINAKQGDADRLNYEFSPDGRYIMSQELPIRVFDLQTEEEIATLDIGRGIGLIDKFWLPSNHLVYVEYAGLGDDRLPLAYIWHPENNTLLSLAEDFYPEILPSDIGQRFYIMVHDVYGAYLPYFQEKYTPGDDRKLGQFHRNLYIYDATANESRHVISNTRLGDEDRLFPVIHWAPDGRYAVLQFIKELYDEVEMTYLLDASSFTARELDVRGYFEHWLMDGSGFLYTDDPSRNFRANPSRIMRYDLATASSYLFYDREDNLTTQPILTLEDKVWLASYEDRRIEDDYTIISIAPDGTVLETIDEFVAKPSAVRVSPTGEAIVFHDTQTDALIVRRTGEDNLLPLEGGLMPEWVDDDLLLYHRQVNNQSYFSLFDVAKEESCDLGEGFINVKVALPAAGS